jgi:hypothetical protein
MVTLRELLARALPEIESLGFIAIGELPDHE